MKKTLGILIVVLIACNLVAQTKQNASDNLSFLLDYNGKSPLEIKLFDNPIIKKRMLNFMGTHKYDYLKKIWKVTELIEVQDSVLFVSGKETVSDHANGAIMIIALNKNLMSISFYKDSTYKMFGEGDFPWSSSSRIAHHKRFQDKFRVALLGMDTSGINIQGHFFDKCGRCKTVSTDNLAGFYTSKDGSIMYIERDGGEPDDKDLEYYVQYIKPDKTEYSFLAYLRDPKVFSDESNRSAQEYRFTIEDDGIHQNGRIFNKQNK